LADWSDPELLRALAISIVGIVVGLRWLYNRILLKLEEVEERKNVYSEGPSGSDLER
jgi:hypothetical protein